MVERSWWSWPRERVVAAGVLGGLFLVSVGLWVAAVVTADDEPAADPSDDVPLAEPDPDAEDDPPAPDDGDDHDAAEDPDAGAAEVLELDGRCVVEVDPGEVDDVDAVRAWEFPECEHAPVDPTDAAGPWIVVVASLDGGEVTEGDARARAAGGAGHQLLWSSHYPSLNPDLWVVFEGPFPDEDAAVAAADELGGGSYPRLLSDDASG